jgi:hypothetical protein
MPFLPFLAGFLLFRLFRARVGSVEAFVSAAIVWGVLIYLIAEGLSLVGGMGFPGVAAAWSAIVILLGCYAFRRGAPVAEPEPIGPLPAWAVVPTLFTVVITLLLALVAPPNSTDVLTYHLARVAQWMQQGTIYPYATSVTRRPADTAVIEANSAQTSVVLAFWGAAFIWMSLGRDPRSYRHTLLAGGALGLAILSKGTAYPLFAPFGVWWLFVGRRSVGVRTTAGA